MSEEFPDRRILWLKLKNISENVTCTGNSNILLIGDIEKEFSEITSKQEVINLSLSSNQLTELSISFGANLAQLIYLDLSNNRLSDLPDSFNSLKSLQRLYLHHNQFSTISNVFNKLKSLRTLKVNNNMITAIIIDFKNLKHLEDLDLSSNMLSSLPPSTNNSNLRSLSIANNKFQKIPDCVVNGLRNLQYFDFSQNYGAEINIPPNSIKLKTFSATNNDICPFFPQWILHLRYLTLETVSLDKTEFRKYDIPENLLNCYIRKLSMRSCKLTDTPMKKILSGMVNLDELIIGNIIPSSHKENNSFWSVPIASVKRPLSLKHIDLRSTGIPMMHKNISNFVNLVTIDIGLNGLSWFPEEICLLTKLKSLKVNNNTLATLPKNIGNMESLEELIACHNNLCQLPDSIRNLRKLKFLDLYNNELQSMPEQIAALPNLQGLDLEQNSFSMNYSLIDKDVRYGGMKTILRNHWCDYSKVLDGPKFEPLEDSESFQSLNTSENSLEYSYSISEMLDVSNDNMDNEIWNISYDSADEFDPNDHREPCRTSISPLVFYQLNQQVFCPAESHETRVISRISKMIEAGTLVWPEVFEEGQFEDPDDNI